MKPTPKDWTYYATCNHCGVDIPCKAIGGTFMRQGDDLAYVVTLDRLEVEAHMLTHEVKV